MKLTDDQVAAVERQTGAKPISTDDPVITQLIEAFGDHTFYLDPNGLHVLEKLPEDMEGVTPGTVSIIQIAEWVGDDRSGLAPIDPKPLDVVFQLQDDDTGSPSDSEPT